MYTPRVYNITSPPSILPCSRPLCRLVDRSYYNSCCCRDDYTQAHARGSSWTRSCVTSSYNIMLYICVCLCVCARVRKPKITIVNVAPLLQISVIDVYYAHYNVLYYYIHRDRINERLRFFSPSPRVGTYSYTCSSRRAYLYRTLISRLL